MDTLKLLPIRKKKKKKPSNAAKSEIKNIYKPFPPLTFQMVLVQFAA